jgi:hypothetical protein
LTRDVHDVDEHPVAVFVHAGEGCKKALTATAAIECLKKNAMEKHLSPSRRRASCSFLLQAQV